MNRMGLGFMRVCPAVGGKMSKCWRPTLTTNRLAIYFPRRNYDNRRPWRVSGSRSIKTPNPLLQGNNVVWGIVGVNLAVFGAWKYAEEDRKVMRFMSKHFTISFYGLFNQYQVHTLLTSFFSHRDGMHLLANMLTLYFFGTEALFYMGARRFITLYFGGGAVSGVCFAGWPAFIPKDWPARYRNSQYTPGLGASGAVSAVVAWSILMFPSRMVYLYMIVPVPAALLGVGYLAYDLYGLYRGSGNVGNAAHLGGAAYGAIYWLMRR